MTKCKFIEGGAELLDSVGPLWKKLTFHHSGISRYFKEDFGTMPWPVRKKDLLDKAMEGKVRIVLARPDKNKRFIGYCIGAINPKAHAEIESLFVEEKSRGKGIATRLVRLILDWFELERAKPTSVNVAVGNEGVIRLYKRFGFYPRTTMLVRKASRIADSK